MVFIREENTNDIEAIGLVHRSAFETESEAQLVDQLRKTNFYSRNLSLLAIEDGNVVGHVLFMRVVIKDGNRTFPAIALAPLAVKPEYQNKGIGTQLVKAGLEKCKYMGNKLVIVLGDPKYYSRFGFELASHHEILPPNGFPEENFMVCTLMNNDISVKGVVQYPREFLK